MPNQIFPQLEQLLTQILATLDLKLPSDVPEKILQYLTILEQWNQIYNLTAIRNPEEMLYKHIADSLACAPYLQGQRWLDVGSGAGLPGIPLALAFPDWEWTLLDSNGKKTRFLLQVKTLLNLSNVTIVQSRVENFKPQQCFDGVIARAFAKLSDMMVVTGGLYCRGGRLWALKGVYPEAELQAVTLPFTVQAIKVPGLEEQRHLVCVSMN
ncbi:MAG TPA: 16S rRNA (guanine(527)-N(7))-methyltransferase RsmG [Gammaproteobacteria bacterium]|nr:16S rRNA (guanine(527)-N(7))-methyltransferase RsmG [Gammaproteobacteria bacterium]